MCFVSIRTRRLSPSRTDEVGLTLGWSLSFHPAVDERMAPGYQTPDLVFLWSTSSVHPRDSDGGRRPIRIAVYNIVYSASDPRERINIAVS